MDESSLAPKGTDFNPISPWFFSDPGFEKAAVVQRFEGLVDLGTKISEQKARSLWMLQGVLAPWPCHAHEAPWPRG